MKKMRILSLILALVMLCSVFLVACGGEEEQQGGGAGNLIIDEESEDASKKYDAEVKNLNGHEFRFVVRNSSTIGLTTHEVYAEAPNGDKINDAVYARNAQLQEKYNCTIKEDRTSKPHTALKEPLTAGEYIADYVFTGVYDLRTLAQSNLCADLTNVKTINLSKAWWDANGFYGMNIAGKTFFVNGDGCTLDDRACWIMYFNKGYVAEYTSKNLYKEVDEGRWTIDLMYEIMEGTWKDVDGDGQMTHTDVYGYGAHTFMQGALALQYGMGQFITEFDKNGDPQLVLNSDRMAQIVGKIDQLSKSPEFHLGTGNAEKADITLFKEGRLMFLSAIFMQTDLNMREMKDEYGVLPHPKLDESQEQYYTVINTQCYMYSVPITVKDQERSTVLFEAYSYEGYKTVYPGFYELALKAKYSHDDVSAQIYDLIMKGRIVDFGFVFGTGAGMRDIISNLVSAGSLDFASAYASKEAATKQAYADIMDAFAKLQK